MLRRNFTKIVAGVSFAASMMGTTAMAEDIRIALVVKALGIGFFEAAPFAAASKKPMPRALTTTAIRMSSAIAVVPIILAAKLRPATSLVKLRRIMVFLPLSHIYVYTRPVKRPPPPQFDLPAIEQ